MTSSNVAPTPSAEPDQTGRSHTLVGLAGYAFLVQGLIFVAIAVLLPMNTRFFEPHATVDWPDFLTELDAAPTQFLTIKVLMLALRTLYGISIVGIAVAWWSRSRAAATLVASFILVSIPVINTAQLMGMALVPLAGDYTAAAGLDDTATMTSIETTAKTIYIVAEYLDTFVNIVPFVGLLAGLFWLSTRVAGLERIKWILPLLIVLPYNRFVELPTLLQLGAGLLNVVATGAYFFLMAWFVLGRQPRGPAQERLSSPDR